MTRSYLSNIRSSWPIDRQEEVLDRDVPDWRNGAVYRDILSRQKIAKRTGLEERDKNLLRPHGRLRGGMVYVASLSVLAWSADDLTAVLMRLAARRDELIALAEKVRIDPTQADVEQIREAFRGAVRRFSEVGVQGGKASGDKRMAEAQAKCERMRPFWGLRDETTASLCERFDISIPTAILYLGKRREAQQRYEAGLKISASNRRRKQRGITGESQ